jgi:hypothetical protein
MAAQPFELVYDPEALLHFVAIEPKYHSLIHDRIEEQLLFEPDVETKDRKLLRQPASFGAEWEIRFSPSNRFRVFYRVNRDVREVRVLAIGVKVSNRLYIGGQEVEL